MRIDLRLQCQHFHLTLFFFGLLYFLKHHMYLTDHMIKFFRKHLHFPMIHFRLQRQIPGFYRLHLYNQPVNRLCNGVRNFCTDKNQECANEYNRSQYR